MNPNLERERLRAALRSRPIPIPTLAVELGVSIEVIEAFITTDATLTAELTASLAALLERTEQRKIPAPARTPHKRNAMPTLTARALKCTLVLDAKELMALPHPADSVQRIVFQIAVAGGRNLTADLPAKGVRKCRRVITEHGVENVALILQGRLTDGTVVHDAGLVAQVKVAKSNGASS